MSCEEENEASSSEDEEIPCRRCIVCLRLRRFTEDIFDSSKTLYYHIDVLLAHLNLEVKEISTNSGLCPECMNHLQRWHVFNSAIAQRHEEAKTTGAKIIEEKVNLGPFEEKVYKNYKKMGIVKEVYNDATHSYYAKRHLTEKDWDFFCDHLFHSNSVKSEKSKELEKFLTNRDRLSKLFCIPCQKLIPNGKRGYAKHMQTEHKQTPVLFPCDICGNSFPERTKEKSSAPSSMDYFQHWVSHFQSNSHFGGSDLLHQPDQVLSSTTPTWTEGTTTIEETSMMDETEEEQAQKNPKKRKKNPTSTNRRQRCEEKMSQIKGLLHNSSFQHLIRRDLDEDSLEYMAERLLTTKSNSSAKLKEIENMISTLERMRNVFCEDCRKTVPGGKAGYYKHRKLEHQDTEEDLTIPCDICGNFYPEKDLTGLSQNYFAHWISHFYFEECTSCQEKYPNENLLKKHKLLHEKRPGYPCPQCDKVLSKKITLDQHIKTHLPEEEKIKNALKCEICGKTITAPTLKAHMFSVHSGERPWKCEVCGARFKHKSDLNGHRNAVHLKIKNYSCNICGKSFGHHCGLRVHIMSHENKRNHSCTTCGKRFLTLWHLKKHSVTHKEVKDIICPTCGKGFKKEESLQEHVTIHTGEMPYECHICGRKVRVLSNLYKHFMVHKKNKTYYSKKDGLPDPLDSYIVEQQKKKSVNKIILEAEGTKGHQNPEVGDSSSSDSVTIIGVQEAEGDVHELEPELQVNRSTNRVVTYRGSSRNAVAKVNPGQSSKSETMVPEDIVYPMTINDNALSEIKGPIPPSGHLYVIQGEEDGSDWPQLNLVIIGDIDQITTHSNARPQD